MATLLVPTEYVTIDEAMAAAQPGDLIVLEPGYSGETVSVTVDNITQFKATRPTRRSS